MSSDGRRKLFLWLVVSIGANLLLVGWFFGDWTASQWRGPPFPPPPFFGVLTASLSEAGVKVMTQTLGKTRKYFEDNFSERRASEARIDKILTATPFDRNAFLAEKKNQRDRRTMVDIGADEIFADGIAQLSPSDREILAADLSRRPRPRGF